MRRPLTLSGREYGLINVLMNSVAAIAAGLLTPGLRQPSTL
jgi:hypothetical protein